MALVLLGLINSVISLYFYARIIKAMVFEKSADETVVHVAPMHRAVIGLCMFPIVFLGIYWPPVYHFTMDVFRLW